MHNNYRHCFIHSIVATLAICATSAFAQTDSTQSKNVQGTKTVPVFENGEAQRVKGFSDPNDWINHDLWVETDFDSDGDGKMDRMHVAVSRPRQTDTEGLKLPVVYVTSPYFAGVGSTAKEYFWDPKQELGDEPKERGDMPAIAQQSLRPVLSNSHSMKWIPLGYIVVYSSSPGTGLSQGCPTVGGDNESLAPKAVIDWLCGRGTGYTTPDGTEKVEASWCTGKVGMTGTSYNGTLPLAAATTGVEGLEAIIPIAPNTSYYHYYRSNGLVRHPGGYMGEDIDVLYDFINSGNPDNRDYCNTEIRQNLLQANIDRATGDYNDFWAGRDYLTQLGPHKAATLMSHGFNDWNVMPEHSIRIYQALKQKGVPTQLYMHQDGHGGPPPLTMMNRWFTRYLHGVENNVEQDPHSWIVREDAKQDEPTAYAEYPHPDSAMVKLSIGKGGNKVGSLETEPSTDQSTEVLIDNVDIAGEKLASADESENRLLYATAELKEPLHLSGTARIDIKLACNKPAANLSVWVVSLPFARSRKINDNIITRGWADPQNYRSLTESEPLEPGKFYELSFELQPDDQIIPKGQRIGLMIFSSDRDFTLWPEPGTELTIDLNATSLELPVVGGQSAFQKATGQ